MDTISKLTNALLVLIPLGGAARVAYCLTAVNVDPDEEKTYRVRARNAAVFCLLAESVTGLLAAVTRYYN